jgi:hypothetical protein
MVTWKEFAGVERELAETGRSLLIHGPDALQTFPQPKPGSDERDAVFRDARHTTDTSEVLLELGLERVMPTRWENVLTPEMRPVHTTWRAPGAAMRGACR